MITAPAERIRELVSGDRSKETILRITFYPNLITLLTKFPDPPSITSNIRALTGVISEL